ncbi:MAG: hypothetical protein R3C04_08800 [Hyphomonas sp.]
MADTLPHPSRRIRKKAGYHHGDLRNAIIEAVARLIAERKFPISRLKDVGSWSSAHRRRPCIGIENKQVVCPHESGPLFELVPASDMELRHAGDQRLKRS